MHVCWCLQVQKHLQHGSNESQLIERNALVIERGARHVGPAVT